MERKSTEKKDTMELGINKDRIQADFLLREHQYFAESFAKNEAVGEKRINFLITIVLAILSVLVGLATVERTIIDLDLLLMVGILAMFALLLLSHVTLLRIIYRNKRTDEWKARLDTVRNQFRQLDKRLEDYYPFGKKIQRRTGFRKFGTGGLVEFTMAIIIIILMALVEFIVASVFILIDMFLSIYMIFVMIVSFVMAVPSAWYGLQRYISTKYEESKDDMFEWRIFWTDDKTKPWKENHYESIEKILGQADAEEREDHYINLGQLNSGLKITCHEEDDVPCKLELKYRVEHQGILEKWMKPISLHLEERMKPNAKQIQHTAIKGLEEILNSLNPKSAKESTQIAIIRKSVHLILSGKFQIVTISKKRSRVRAHFDQQSKSWQFQLSHSKLPDTIILESTEGTFLSGTSRESKCYRTVCVEGENEELILAFKNFFISKEFGHVANYPMYIQDPVDSRKTQLSE